MKKKDWLTLIISIIAASAWIPHLLNFFKTPEIQGKIISHACSPKAYYKHMDWDGQINQMQGIVYVLKLSIIALNKNFNLKDIELYVKYPSDNKKYKGEIYRCHNQIFNIDVNGKTIRKKLKIPNDQHISSISILEKDKVNSCYVLCIVDKSNYELFEEFEFRFYDYRGNCKKLIVSRKDIDVKRILYEKRIWEELP